MKIKIGHEVYLYNNSKATASKIVYLIHDNGDKFKTFKFTYSNGNAFEHFNIELFDGNKLNLIATITDIGVNADYYAYNLLNDKETKNRVLMLMDKGYEYIKLLF